MLKISRQILFSHIRGNHGLSSILLQRKFQREPKRLYSSDKEDVSYNLTKPEALTYLENVLGIPDPLRLLNNKVAFLGEMRRQTMYKIPFTNISYFREGKIKNLSLEEIKEAMFKREGGNCMALNTFACAVLEILGFDVYLVGGSAQRWKRPLYANLWRMVVKDLTGPGTLHLFDVGSRFSFPLIDLDFDRISEVYPMNKWLYRFFQVSPGVVQLTSKCECPKPGRTDGLIYAENNEYWEVMITFWTSTRIGLAECWHQHETFTKSVDRIPEVSDAFLLVSYPNNILVNIANNICTIETENGNTEVTEVKNSLQIVDIILKHFPQYSRNHLESMAECFAKKSRKKNL